MSAEGLAWDPATRSLWTNAVDTLRQVDPETCTAVRTVTPTLTTRGELFRVSDVDPDGDLLAVFRYSDVIGEFVATDPAPTRVPWLAASEWSGTIAPRRSQRITLGVARRACPTAPAGSGW